MLTAHLPQVALHAPGSARGPALGWGISVLVHALAIVWLWHVVQPRPAHPDGRPATRIEVRLVPRAATAPSGPALPHAEPRRSPVLREPRSRAAVAAPVMVQPPAVTATLAAPVAQREAAQVVAPDAPAFDLAAARASARTLAREERVGMAAAPLRQGMDASPSERIQERLEHARRGNCLKANDSVNLLANVAMLAKGVIDNAIDDSGCKW